ncbi:MAG: hypothetical protein CL912_33850 [Deltaproteobacteria bacterium]|nr:hypothetical protein [Deltaproteobacteria bacterium]
MRKSNFADDTFSWDEESSVTEVPTEMVQSPLALGQPTAPPSSPNLLPSKCFVTLSDAQELAKAMMDMQMPSGHAPKCTCSHTPPEYPSQATSIDLYSPTFPTNQTSPQIVTVLDLLKSLNTKQEPPPKSPERHA